MKLDDIELGIIKDAEQHKVKTVYIYLILSASALGFVLFTGMHSILSSLVLFLAGALFGISIEKIMSIRLRMLIVKMHNFIINIRLSDRHPGQKTIGKKKGS
jgi:hypothetical protein